MNLETPEKTKPSTTAGTSPQTGAQYLESIRDDGREVWLDGERVKDVTTHPAFRNSARMVARLYDSLHDESRADVMRMPLRDGSGWTHAAFQAPRNLEESLQQKDAYAEWARIGYGWLGRSPDFIGAAFAPSFQLEGEYFDEYAPNVERAGAKLARDVPFIGHAIVNPPIDRQDPSAASDIMIRVEKETDEGLVISGAKVVATGTAIAQQLLIAHHFIPVTDKKYAPVFILDVNRPGVNRH